MKTHKVVDKMAFQVFRKLKFWATILKFHSTKRENARENLNQISFFTWVASKNPNNLSLCFIFGP